MIKEDREGKQRSFGVFELENGVIKQSVKTETTGTEKSKLFPSDIGAVVNDFLVQHFNAVVDFNFTAKVEKEFDEIAQGMQEWTKMIETFYRPFHKEVESTMETAERANGQRELGFDPETNKKISVRIGRYGPFVQIGETVEGSEEKPRYASLKAGQMIESITLEDALELFKLPKLVGQFEEKDMKVAIGRFGPYISHNSAFYSLTKEQDPHTLDEPTAIQIIQDKRQKDIDKLILTFPENPEVKVLNGRWGPFIAVGKQNVKIPKGVEPTSLTLEQCLELAKDAPPAKKAPNKRFAKAKK